MCYSSGRCSAISRTTHVSMNNMPATLKTTVSLLLCLMGTTAKAGLIVDTGPGGPSGWSLTPSQSLAGEFSTSSDTYVTGIEAYMQSFEEFTTATASIFSDGGDVPGSLLYASQFTVEPRPPSQTWRGPQELNWFLEANTYWLVLSVEDDDTYFGWITRDAERPLGNYAFTRSDTGDWSGNDGLNLSFRVVPEPTSLSMIALALIGVAASRRRRKFEGAS